MDLLLFRALSAIDKLGQKNQVHTREQNVTSFDFLIQFILDGTVLVVLVYS